MDKQRLLELAGITEAKYSRPPAGYVVVYTNHGDVGQVSGVWGPFQSQSDAHKFVDAFLASGEIDAPDWSDPVDEDWFDVWNLEDPSQAFTK